MVNSSPHFYGSDLQPVKAGDFMSLNFIAPEWIVENLIATRGETERGFKGDVIAGSKMRKTFFALQLAVCVAAGLDFLGFTVPRPRKVLYLGFELRKDFLCERLEKMISAITGKPAGELDTLHIVAPTRPYLVRNRYDATGNLVEGLEDELISYIKAKRYELVVVDPLYKMLAPEEDENNGRGLGGVMRWRDRIITETSAAVLFVHHDNKSDGKDTKITSRGSGSGVAGRDYDVRFALSEHADGDKLHEVMEAGSRVAVDPAPVTIVFDKETLTFSTADDVAAERKTAKRASASMTPGELERKRRTSAENAARKIFDDHADKGDPARATAEDYLLPMTTFRSYLAERADIPNSRIADFVKMLIADGVLNVQQVLKRDDEGKVKFAGATVYVGTPNRIAAYRETFGLIPDGDDLRAHKGRL